MRILVPMDFSAPSDAALARARQLVDPFDAELHLIHIAENPFLRAVVSDSPCSRRRPGASSKTV